MEALLAGFVAGLAMGILAVALLGAEIVRHPKAIQQFHGRFPKGTSLPQLMAGMALSLQAGWGAVGMVVGAAYSAIQSNAQNGLGSPAWGFTLFFLILALMGLASVLLINPSWWRRGLFSAVVFAGAFGWMLPNLAEA
ncbi:MAG TPA: hypothetical protein QGF05_11545 [Dehalococcoidia bacterium]|nr:hypothetical protein [Dehalococcoidia bacterium]